MLNFKRFVCLITMLNFKRFVCYISSPCSISNSFCASSHAQFQTVCVLYFITMLNFKRFVYLISSPCSISNGLCASSQCLISNVFCAIFRNHAQFQTVCVLYFITVLNFKRFVCYISSQCSISNGLCASSQCLISNGLCVLFHHNA